MNGIEQKTGHGTEADAEVLYRLEHKFLQNYIVHLSKEDRVAVDIAKYRLDTLKEIAVSPFFKSRVERWQEIEVIDEVHMINETYLGAVWALERLDPPLIDNKTGKRHVFLFKTGKGSAYIKDDEGNVRPRITTK